MVQDSLRQRSVLFVSTVLGSLLVGLPLMSSSTSAQTTPGRQQNPCPGIYYEEPHNSARIVPQGCPPNAATQRLMNRGQVSGGQSNPTGSSVNVIQPPLPENQQNAIANITPVKGQVSIRLKNNTNAQIFYQAVGYTDRRTLAGGEETVLRGLPTPVTITMTRQDEGLLKVMPVKNEMMSAEQPEMLSISLDETNNLDDTQGTLRIQQDGQVFLF